MERAPAWELATADRVIAEQALCRLHPGTRRPLSGTFTRDAERFAEGRNIELIDGASLQRLLQQARTGTKPAVKVTAASMVGPDATRIEPVGSLEPAQGFGTDQPAAMRCPRCTKPMVLRVARRGASAGQSFWGCSAFSDGCRGIRPL
ncbi:hypothetical protein PY257_15435 [Ramlibacter sp. H39-3-26]|uniref:hypothetical protein n=1 Tax=Curvibacter soli TaxID=3031331 RepID=UPI0023DC0F28|nr:hypothetical protein [Ramlibacter sp. H39-3-26]MDF1486555.1 hypothetical protein [Ramlibacter sp. H39-3-26]